MIYVLNLIMVKRFTNRLNIKVSRILIVLTILLFLTACADTQNYNDEVMQSDEVIEVEDLESYGAQEIESSATQTIFRFYDDNVSITLTRNEIDMSAEVDFILFQDSNELQNEFMDLTNFTISFSCGLFAMAFFNESALDEFNQIVSDWNEMNQTIESDSDMDAEDIENDPLKGYEVTRVHLEMLNKIDNKSIAECEAVGASESDITIIIH